MKRIILLLVAAITVVACGKGDDKNESNTKKFNPPAWIQGTWLDSNNIGYKFEVNDFCVIVPTQEICYNQGIFATEVTDVKEEKTDNTYKVSFRLSNATTYIYEFIENLFIYTDAIRSTCSRCRQQDSAGRLR